VAGLWTAAVSGLTGCASGGFKMTRQYAGFVNKQNIVLRIILYILTGVVFAVTMLLDVVIFNTMDFWDGRVSQGTFKFEGEGKTYFVEHKLLENNLKQSRITIVSAEKTQEVLMKQTQAGSIQVFLDGRLQNEVKDIGLVPTLVSFDQRGQVKASKVLAFDTLVAKNF